MKDFWAYSIIVGWFLFICVVQYRKPHPARFIHGRVGVAIGGNFK